MTPPNTSLHYQLLRAQSLQHRETIDFRQPSSGMYSVRVKTDTRTEITRVMKADQ